MRLSVLAMSVLAMAAITLALSAPSSAQTAADPQLCSFSGTVVDAITGLPLRDASVTTRGFGSWSGSGAGSSSGAPPGSASTVSDAEGRFSFENMAPGRYFLFGSSDGYVGRGRDSSRTQLACAGGQNLTDVTLKLTPGATISGQVLGGNNKALINVRLEALRHVYRLGRPQFQTIATAVSDKAGEYRLPSLPPGKYYLRAVPQQPKKTALKSAYVPSYYPATPAQGGSNALDVRAGEQLAGVAIALTPVHTVTVSGKIVSASGKLSGSEAEAAELTVVEEGGLGSWPYETEVDAKGNFELAGIPAGNYVLMAHCSEKDKPVWGQKSLQVADVDLRNVEIAMNPGVDLSGHISVDGNGNTNPVNGNTNADVDLSRLVGNLEPDQNSAVGNFAPEIENAFVGNDGGFTFHDVPPGNYRISFHSPGGGYYMKAAQSPNILETGITVAAGQPVRNLDFVLSPGAGHIDGTVMQDDQPSSGVLVALVPDGARRAQLSYFRQTTTDRQGRFQLENIAPGDYKLFAWQGAERGAYMDPEFLQQYEDDGKSVSVKEGASLNVQLDVILVE
jgi:protocatechuate 3,4-dioxygenase beta subunit